MRYYQIFKIKANGYLEPMGSYEGNTEQEAVNEMAKRGNLYGNEWAMEYHAIPMLGRFRKYRPKVK